MIYTSANSHLGDILWFCHALRRIPGPHTYYCPLEYHWQLRECLEDCDVELRYLSDAPPDAINTWIAADKFGVIYDSPVDIVDFIFRWSNAVIAHGGGTPFTTRQELLMDFPAIKRNVVAPDFDILVINCAPLSGQCWGWTRDTMEPLIEQLSIKHRVLCTNPVPQGLNNVNTISASVANIGNLSIRAKLIVAVASGPHCCIHNPWNQHVPKYLFLDPIRMDYGQPIVHAKDVEEMRGFLKAWL